jgi:hypothetical protein
MPSINQKYTQGGIEWVAAPTSETSTGKVGQWASDGTYLYMCYATNLWIRFVSAGWSTEVPPANTVAPAVTGTVDFGETITCSTGSWTGAPTSYAYAWYADGVLDSALGTANEAVIVARVSEKVLKCRVTATNAYGSSSAYSNEVTVPLTVPTNAVAPVLSGTIAIDSTLTCSTGTWYGNPTFSYAWYVDGSEDAGLGTANTLLLTPELALADIKCEVTGTNTEGTDSVFSNERAINVAPYNTLPPALTGTVDFGETLTCELGDWAGAPSSYTYAWYVDSVLNSGLGTANHITITAELSLTEVSCRLTATNAYGSTSMFSDSASIPLSPPVSSIAPSLSGSSEIGETLTCSNGMWFHAPTVFSYAWFIDDIEDPTLGTANTLTLTEDLSGTMVKCQVTATNAAGSTAVFSNTREAGSSYTPSCDFSDERNSMYVGAIL